MRLSLLLFVSLLMPGLARSQAVIVLNAPPSAPVTTQFRMPNGSTAHAFVRGHFILAASELSGIATGTTLQSFGMNYAAGVPGAAGGTFKVYLENTTSTTNVKSTVWATAIASMTPVYTGPLDIPVGTSPVAVDLVLNGSPFAYTGSGLYVAYEYVGATFATTAATYLANSSLPSSLYMNNSLSSLPTEVTTVTSFRPQVRLGVLNPHQLDLAVDSLSVRYGDLNAVWDDEISVTLANRGAIDQSDVPVLLEVVGANAQSQSLTTGHLNAGDSITLTAPKSDLQQGAQTVTATVGPDEVTANDQLSIAQEVSCAALSYAGSRPAFDGIGFGTSSGILAVRYTAPSVPISVDGVFVDIYSDTASVGKTVSGQLLNAAGVIVGSSAPLVLGTEHLGTRVHFPLLTPVPLAAGDRVYAGLLQTAGASAFPVAAAAPANTTADRFFSFAAGGGSKVEYTAYGTFKIGIQATPVVTMQVGADGYAVRGQPVNIAATPGYGHYTFLVNGNSAQSGSSNVLTYLAQTLDVVSVTATRNACGVGASVNVPVKNSVTTTANGNGTISPASRIVADGEDTTFTVTPATSHHADVTGCDGVLSGTTYTTGAITANCAVVASFAIDTYAVTATGGANGDIAPPSQTVDHGATTTFTVTPATGYHANVTGCDGVLSGTTYTTGAITADCAVTASFAINQYTLTYSSGANGMVNGTLLQTVDHGASGSAVDAVASAGYHFTQWSDGSTGNPRTDSNVTADIDVSASFAVDSPALSLTMDADRDYARYGQVLSYSVTLSNSGTGAANPASIAMALPAQLDASNTTWECTNGGAGAQCTASGSGALQDNAVILPAGRALTWLVATQVRLDAPGGDIETTVSASSGAINVSANDRVTLVTMRDGFELNGDGAQGAGVAGDLVSCASAVEPAMIDEAWAHRFTLPPAFAGLFDSVLVARGQNGVGFRVERANLGDTTQVQLIAIAADGHETASAWARVQPGATLTLAIASASNGQRALLLDGAATLLSTPLSVDVSDALWIETSAMPDAACN